MNKWFAGVFLPSIFERCGNRREMWLSQKQTAICVDNMELRQVRYDADGCGTMYNHNNYVCDWNGRRVVLSYSKKNGCGYISFGNNAAEEEARLAQIEAEKAAYEAERIARFKADPEKLEKIIAFYTMKLEAAKARLQADMDDPDSEPDDIEWDSEQVSKYEAELAKYIS